jgi:hypothetical protein
MKTYGVVAALACVTFAGFTVWPAWTEGYFGFLRVHMQGPWGYQVILDLLIALTLFLAWMIPDARRQRLPVWPFVLAVLATGSIGALAYVAVRGWRAAALRAAT